MMGPLQDEFFLGILRVYCKILRRDARHWGLKRGPCFVLAVEWGKKMPSWVDILAGDV